MLLANNPIADEHLIHIAKMDALEFLQLQGTKITDDGLKHLTNLKNLTYIGLKGTKVTDAAALAFRKKFPKCDVEHPAISRLWDDEAE